MSEGCDGEGVGSARGVKGEGVGSEGCDGEGVGSVRGECWECEGCDGGGCGEV